MISPAVQRFLEMIPMGTEYGVSLQSSSYDLVEYNPGVSTYFMNHLSKKWHYGIIERGYTESQMVSVSYSTVLDEFYRKNCLDVERVNLAVQLYERVNLLLQNGLIDSRVRDVLLRKIPTFDGQWSTFVYMLVAGGIPNMQSILNELVGLRPMVGDPDQQVLLMCIATEIGAYIRFFNATHPLRQKAEEWLIENVPDFLTNSTNAEDFLTDLWSAGNLGLFANQKDIIDSFRGKVPLNPTVYNQPPLYPHTVSYGLIEYSIDEYLYSNTVGWVYKIGRYYVAENVLVESSPTMYAPPFSPGTPTRLLLPKLSKGTVTYVFEY